MKKSYWTCIMIITVIGAIAFSCQSLAEKETKNEEYAIKVNQELTVYGINIKKLINHTFSQIEREIGAKIEVDQEVSVIFIDKEKDFVLKSIGTKVKDYIDFLYGPVNDTKIYNELGSVKPKAIVFYGYLKVNETLNIKKTITKELKEILPLNQVANEILDKIESMFFSGSYLEGQKIQVNFDTPDFEVAYFLITFMQGEIHYRYVFSKTEDIYPYL